MIYTVDLKIVGAVTGAALVVSHLLALASSNTLVDKLRRFPRSKVAGSILLTVAAVWAFALINTMDLGEFAHLKPLLSIIIPAAYFLTLFFVDEFLAVRSLGMIALLASCVLLDAAYLKPEITRLFLVVLAYAWVVAGLFWVGTPYVLRNQIDWLIAKPGRLKLACFGGLIYGVLLIVLAFTRY